MQKTQLESLVILRAAVAFLGEKRDWWRSKFYDTSSKDFLSYIFPKSKNSQFSCSNISTRSFIDNEVGANYYHLFRLPISLEELVSNNVRDMNIQSFESEESAIELLMKLANNLSVDGKSGPKNIGSSDNVNGDILQVFAAEYLNAFENDYKVHPYLN